MTADNTLRIRCAWQRDQIGPIDVVLSSVEEPERVVAGDPYSLDVEIIVWDLLAETSYDWSIRSSSEIVATGTLTTPPLPEGLAPVVTVEVDGPSSVERTLVSLSCDLGPAMFALDAQGRVRWYQEAGVPGLITGFDWTDRGTVAFLVGRSRATERRLSGEPVVDLSLGAGLQEVLHHSIVGRGDDLLALHADDVLYPDGNEYVIDGISRLTPDGSSSLWEISSILDPTSIESVGDPFYWGTFFPGAVDFAHANSIEVWEGDWLLSFKHIHAVVRVDPDDGHVVWWFSGSPQFQPIAGPRLALTSSAGISAAFEHQHHVNPTPWGTLLLVDNGLTGELSRVLEIAVDSTSGTADILRAWELGVDCPVQSSAFGLSDGTVLASCARTKEIFELDASGIRRRTELSCDAPRDPLSFTRAHPVPSLR